jgi:hypothetical protein
MGTSERGEFRASSIFSLLVLAAVVLVVWNVAPVYIDHYALQDKVNEIARTPRWSANDEKIMDMLMKYVREERLDGYIKRNQFTMSTVETNRVITLQYQRPAQILPGWKHTFSFSFVARQPLL